MTTGRTDLGREVEAALGEVLAHVRGETSLPCRIVDDPAAEHIVALRKRMKLSRQRFADRFGLDVRAVQEWEQGRPGVETRGVVDGVNVDIDARGNLVGFDIDRAANRLDLSSLETTALPLRSYSETGR